METKRLEALTEDRSVADPIWVHIRSEAADILSSDADLVRLVRSNILDQPSFDRAVIERLAARLDHPDVPRAVIMEIFASIAQSDPSIGEGFRADLMAVADRDPACTRFVEPLLYFKGYHALQTHRFAYALARQGRRDFALYLQSRSSEIFQTDINPDARIGRGVFLDHATGLVVGQTAVIEDDVSILQGVTLGGTGKATGDRHPKIRRGVLIGAGAKILGNIEVGQCARVAAGSVVLKDVPRNVTVAGVPAKIVGESGCAEPARTMDQILADKGGGAA
ncbi:MAG: serine O-acetyltransferase [Alphaproteobacteria bacterium]|jgi:serine O-acetyltransferase|nr:serine O-acetyltransferase [Alphaproteobacteria bacterium]